MSSTPHPTLTYRPDIDGLRAIAVMAVVIYHASPRLLPNGYLGVDVFFVISGFLITSILVRQSKNGTFSILSFFERRIRRICPALFAMMAAVLVVGFFWHLPADYLRLAASVRYAVGSISNILFFHSPTGYFDHSENDTTPLLHTWSLGVEEQFYLIFPLLFLLTGKFKQISASLPWIIAALGLSSLALYIWQVEVHPQAAFYIIIYRAWELAIGSILAFWADAGWLNRCTRRAASGFGLTGILCIGAAMAVTLPQPYPNAMACLGSAMIIGSGFRHPGVGHLFLAWRPVAFIGVISYSVYLWHWPLMAFLSYNPFQEDAVPDEMARVGLGLLSIPIGYLSYRFIETPFRTPSVQRRQVFMTWSTASAALVAAAFIVKEADGFPSRVPAEAMRLIRFERSQNLVGVKEFMDTEKPAQQSFVYGDATQPSHIALWGDSHAHAIAGVLHQIGLERHTSIRFYGKPATAPILGFNQWDSAKTEYTKNVFAALEADPDISCVVLSSCWSAYIKAPPLSEQEKIGIEGQLQASIARLRDAGKKVIVVYPTPQTEFSIPRRLALNAFKHKTIDPDKLPDASDFFTRNEVILRAFDGLPNGADLIRIKPHESMIQNHKILLQTPKGDPFLFDTHHLTQEAANYLRPVFEIIFTANE